MKIFFDVDGVLIDGWHSDSALRRPWDLAIEADLGINRQAFNRWFFGVAGRRRLAPMAECVRGQRDLLDALAEVLPQVGYHGAAADFIDYWFRHDSNVNRPLFELIELLAADPSIELFIASGQEHRRARYLWEELGFKRWFRQMFYSADLGYLKSDPRFFGAINQRLGLQPGDEPPLFFDDQPNIVALARKAGWEAVTFRGRDDLWRHPRLRSHWPIPPAGWPPLQAEI